MIYVVLTLFIGKLFNILDKVYMTVKLHIAKMNTHVLKIQHGSSRLPVPAGFRRLGHLESTPCKMAVTASQS